MTDRNHPFHVRPFLRTIDRSFHLARRVCLVARRRRCSPNLRYERGREGGEGGESGEGGGGARRRSWTRREGQRARVIERPTRLYRRVDHVYASIYLLVRDVLVSFFEPGERPSSIPSSSEYTRRALFPGRDDDDDDDDDGDIEIERWVEKRERISVNHVPPQLRNEIDLR